MMQPRDAHCLEDVVSDCAVDEEEETLLPRSSTAAAVVMTSSSTNPHPAEVLVGAKKRKALRVVKHQQVSPSLFAFSAAGQVSDAHPHHHQSSSPIKTDDLLPGSKQTTGGGNTSMDTGVSSDLSESRPSLLEEEDDRQLSDSDAAESGGEFFRPDRRRRRRNRNNSGDSSDSTGSARKQRRLSDEEDEDDDGCHPIQQELKCPECDENFSGRAHLIRHTQRAHPAALTAKDVPSGQHLAGGANKFVGDQLLTNPPEEYKNEEDDPFSALLREMKLKGEFPCRLCEAVFPNLRALKGKQTTTTTTTSFDTFVSHFLNPSVRPSSAYLFFSFSLGKYFASPIRRPSSGCCNPQTKDFNFSIFSRPSQVTIEII